MRMADITQKPITKRTAVACGKVFMKKETLKKLSHGGLPKGDAISCAKVAGIMAAKRVPELIPMCHPLEVTDVKLDIDLDYKEGSVSINSKVSVNGRTGVEMEALTAASIAALTIYDMCKPVDKEMVIGDLKLLKKTGGRSGTYVRKG